MGKTLKNLSIGASNEKAQRKEGKTELLVIDPAPEAVSSQLNNNGTERLPAPFKFYRVVSYAQIKLYYDDLIKFLERYKEKSGDPFAKVDFVEYCEFCSNPAIFFLLVLDSLFRCKGYVLAHTRTDGRFVVHQAVEDPAVRGSGVQMMPEIDRMARDAGCNRIEISTRREPEAYGRLFRHYGFKRIVTVFEKEIKAVEDGQ